MYFKYQSRMKSFTDSLNRITRNSRSVYKILYIYKQVPCVKKKMNNLFTFKIRNSQERHGTTFCLDKSFTFVLELF